MVDPKKVWTKVFGRYSIGAIIVPSKRFIKMYSVCYVHMSRFPIVQRIPTDKFVGRIVGYNPYAKKSYYVRWIADRGGNDKRVSLIWREGFFEEL